MKYRNVLFIVLFGLLLTACGGGSSTNNSTEPIVKKSLTTTKVNGNTASYNSIATFYVSLDEKPSADVVIPVSSSDESEGVIGVESLTFTSENYDIPQRILVKGRNNNVVEGKQNYKIVLGVIASSDKTYDGVNPSDVEMKGVYLKLNDVTDSTKFIAGLESSISMNVDYTGFNDLNYTLVQKPSGMTINDSGVITWKPTEADEGKGFDVEVKISDGSLVSEVSFNVFVAKITTIKSELQGNKVTITEKGNLNGLTITKIDNSTNIANIEVQKIPIESVPKTPSFVTKITDIFVIKSKVDGQVKVKLPLSALPNGTDLHYVFLYTLTTDDTDDIKEVFWSPTLIDRNISTENGKPIVEITLTGMQGVYFIGVEDEEEESTVAFLQKMNTNNKVLSKTDLSKITCTPVESDYMNQICTYKDNSKIKITVLQFGRKKTSTRWNGITIKELISYLIDAQGGFDKLNLSYDNEFNVLIHKQRKSNIYGFVRGSENREILHLTNLNKNKAPMQGTIVHEYFHHAQSRSKILGKDLLINEGSEKKWFIEGTARWFEDYLLTYNNELEYDDLNTYVFMENGEIEGILKYGINGKGRPYERFAFFKLLNSKCNNRNTKFKDIFKKLLNINKSNDSSGIKNLSTELSNAGCNFGNQLGESKQSFLESALLYYQYATVYENKISLLDNNEDNNKFNFESTPYSYEENDWSYDNVDDIDSNGDLDVSSIKSIPPYGAYSIKILGSDNPITKGKELILTVKVKSGSSPLTVSLISEDNNFVGNSFINGKKHYHYKTNELTEYKFKGNKLHDTFITLLNPNGEKVEIDNISLKLKKGIPLEANAGLDKTITENTWVILDAIQSKGATSYKWTEGDVLLSENRAFSKEDFSEGLHTITLTVKNDSGDEKTDTVLVTVLKPLIARVTVSSQTVTEGTSITFDSANSQSALTYEWKEGDTVLSTESSFDYTFSTTGTHTITLTIKDTNGNPRSQSIDVVVEAEVVTPTLAKPNNVTITSTTEAISLNWDAVENASFYKICMSETTINDGSKCSENGGTIISGITAIQKTITENLRANKVYYFRVRGAKGGYIGLWSNEVTITLLVSANIPPIANAGANQTINQGESVIFDASASSDSDGTIVSYSWKDSNDNYLGNGATLTVNNLAVGTHTYTVTVTDNDGDSTSNSVSVMVVDTSTVDLTKDLVAWYKFDGDTQDSSGNNNHGTAFGGVDCTVTGVIGQACSFDGVDGRINIDNNILNNKSEFSISFWANSRKSNTAIVSGANSLSDNEFLIYLNGSTNLEFYYHANLNNIAYYTSAVSLLNDNNYQHIYIKFTANETQIYENGLLKQTLNNGFSSNIQIDTNGLWIGMEQDSVGSNGSEFNQYFLGEIDDFRIYSRLLNDTEIQELYKLKDNSLLNGLVAHYKFDGNTQDSSGNNNHGTAFGGVDCTATGIIGQACSFDGLDDYISITSLSSDITTNITMSAWIKAKAQKTDNYTAGGIIFNGADYEFAITADTNSIRYAINGVTNVPSWTDTNIAVNLNEWSLVSIVYNGNKINTYINGIEKSSKLFSGSIYTTPNYPFGIAGRYLEGGGSVPSNGWYSLFQGEIDDLRIYNRDLNNTEVQELYNLGVQ